MSKPVDGSQGGLDIHLAVDLINQQKAMPYGFSVFAPAFNIGLRDHNSTFSPIKFDSDRFYKRTGIKTQPSFYGKPANAFESQPDINRLLEALDGGTSIVMTVTNREYSGGDGIHALCISGYRVDPYGITDLQVIDSARGIFWVPHERIMIARYDFFDYVAEAKVND